MVSNPSQLSLVHGGLCGPIVSGSANTHQAAITKLWLEWCLGVSNVVRLCVSPVFLGVFDRSVLYGLECTLPSRSRFELSVKPNSAGGFLRVVEEVRRVDLCRISDQPITDQ